MAGTEMSAAVSSVPCIAACPAYIGSCTTPGLSTMSMSVAMSDGGWQPWPLPPYLSGQPPAAAPLSRPMRSFQSMDHLAKIMTMR